MADDTNLNEDRIARPDNDHKPHDWPQADENFCSCCRGRIIDGLHNVVRIQTTPEKQMSTSGVELGVDNRKPEYRAFLHASCWKRHFGQRVECDKCGVFSIAKKLSNGQQNPCKCTCHKGANHCSWILAPTERNMKEAGLQP